MSKEESAYTFAKVFALIVLVAFTVHVLSQLIQSIK